MEGNVNIETIDIIGAEERASIDMQIATAKQYPRDIKECINEAVTIACLDNETARSCRYAIPRAGKAITGPSVVAAKIAAQSWGNIRFNSNIKNITSTHVICEAVAFDLQKNIAAKVEVTKSIVGRYGKYSNDMITTTSMAASSIALRNAILSIIPRNVVLAIMKGTKDIIISDLDTDEKIIDKAKSIFSYYKKTYSVTETEFFKLVNRDSFETISKDDIVILYDFYEALIAGDSTPEDIFGRNRKTPTQKKADLKTKGANKTNMP